MFIDGFGSDLSSEDENSDVEGTDAWPHFEFFSNLGITQGGFALHPIADLEPEVLQSMYDLLVDRSSLRQLQRTGAINAAYDAQHADWDDAAGALTIRPGAATFAALIPIRVDGDGNCLLHAVSRALWGVHDAPADGPPGPPGAEPPVGALRAGLRTLLEHPRAAGRLKAAWLRQRAAWDAELGICAAGDCDGAAEEEAAQAEAEWAEEVLRRAGTDGAWLSEVHVFALAHVVRRPIVVYADDLGMPGAPCAAVAAVATICSTARTGPLSYD
jgi:hypothetical protein